MTVAATEDAVLSGPSSVSADPVQDRRVSAKNQGLGIDSDHIILACKDRLVRNPLDLKALADLIKRYVSLSDFAQAKRYAIQYHHLVPDSQEAEALLAQFDKPELKKIWLEKALKAAKEAISLDQYPKATADIAVCLDLAPNNKDVLQVAASYYQGANKPKEAIVCLKKLSELSPKDPYLWSNMAMLCLEIGQPKAAQKALEKLESCQPGDDLNETVAWIKNELSNALF